MNEADLIKRLEKIEERNASLENTVMKIDDAVAKLVEGILTNKTSLLSLVNDIGNMVAIIGKFK